MSTTISPNMNLVIPGVGSEQGPDWANDLNADLSILDGHNHSAGQGVQIQPNGLNINTDLAFNSNNATLLRTTRFAPQLAALTLPADVGCLYVVNNELYYNDVTGGHHIAITNNGNVNAGAGSISGLPSGTASATYSAGTFVWQSATSTAANMDAGSYVFRNATASSKGLTLQPPAAMAADYSVTLPALPGSQSFMTVDTSGNMSGYAPIAQGITRTNLASVGQQISGSSGGFTTSSLAPVAVTNLSVTITTTGRPVMVFCQPDALTGAGFLHGVGTGNAFWQLYRSGVGQALLQNAVTDNAYLPLSSIMFLDAPSAGTYTYSISSFVSAGTESATTFAASLVVYEL